MAFKPLYVEGDYVEVKVREQWELGLIQKMHFRGYIEYDICLLSSGEIVEAQAPIMRKCDRFSRNLQQEMSQEMVDTSQPELKTGTTIESLLPLNIPDPPRRSPRFSPSVMSQPILVVPESPEMLPQPPRTRSQPAPKVSDHAASHYKGKGTYSTRVLQAPGIKPLSAGFSSTLSNRLSRSPGKDIVIKSPAPRILSAQHSSRVAQASRYKALSSATSSHRANPLTSSPGRDIVIPSPQGARARLRGRPAMSTPPPVSRVVRGRGSPYPSPFSLARQLPTSSPVMGPPPPPKATTSSSTATISSKKSRFADVSEEDIANLQLNSKSANTLRNTAWGIGVLREWLVSQSLEVDFENLRKDVLADYLVRFYAAARNQEGQKYSKSSLLGIRGAIQRHLTLPPHNLDINIMTDPAFKKANNVITGTLREMKQTGQDKSKPHPPITADDMKKLYKSGALSPSTPRFLQWKVFFELVLHFGRRGREGLRFLKKEHMIFEVDDDGSEYATLNFNSLEKNHQRFEVNEEEHIQRMYATGSVICPVASLKLYLSRLHPMCDWLFQRPKVIKFLESEIWYYNSPVGVNTIADFMPAISTFAQTSRRYTNHCIRATTVTTLRQLEGIQNQDIMAVTGHKNASSIDHYSKVPDYMRKKLSKNLSAALGSSPKQDDQIAIGTRKVETAARAPKRRSPRTHLAKPVLSDDRSTQPYSECSGVPVKRRKIKKKALKKVSTRKHVEVEKKRIPRIQLKRIVSDISALNESPDHSPVISQARRKLEEKWAIKKDENLISSTDNSSSSVTSQESSQGSEELISSPEAKSPKKKDDGSDKGPSSLFKGCNIEKIKIVYK